MALQKAPIVTSKTRTQTARAFARVTTGSPAQNVEATPQQSILLLIFLWFLLVTPVNLYSCFDKPSF